MRLTVFHAKDGDCLLLTSADGHHVLIDGGRASSFEQDTRPVLQDLAEKGSALDLVIVSHIDADHISGVISLLRDVAAWAVHDFQVTEGKNPSFPEPARPRPPEIKGLWHNSWRAQLGDLAGPISALASHVAEAVELAPASREDVFGPGRRAVDAVTGLAESIADGIQLLRLMDDQTPVTRNAGFANQLVRLRDPAHRERVGSTTLTVVGPAERHVEDLRDECRDWLKRQLRPDGAVRRIDGRSGASPGGGLNLEDLGLTSGPGSVEEAEDLVSSVTTAAEIIHRTNPAAVTPPNRASITVLAEEDGKSCLLTGDAAEEELLEGLQAAGFLEDGRPLHCDVLKVQHHGSENNLSKVFADQVLANDYVFCGDGAHGNPNPSVVKTVIASRLGAPGRFTLWFNCSEQRTLPERHGALKAAIDEARDAAARHPGVVEVRVLSDDRSFFELEI